MEQFALFTIFFVMMNQAATWGPSCELCPCAPPIICPPPVICPPRICPPPVVCPPRICPPCPPQICPPCPPPPPPLPRLPSIPFKPITTCCRTCVCYVRRKRDSSSDHDIMHEIDPVCNNDQLMMIMKKKIQKNATESTFAIKKVADATLGAEFNVFCAINDLTHVAHAENFCQYKKNNVICFAYKI